MQSWDCLCLSCLSALKMFGGPYSEGGQKTSPTRGRAMPALRPQNCGSAGGPQRAARGRMRALIFMISDASSSLRFHGADFILNICVDIP
jgi:hypothetical protein